MAVGIGGAKVGTKALTVELRRLASQAIDVDDDGGPISREAALASLIWKQALGWTERVRDDNGNLTEKKHPPVAWAQQYVFERLEGKVTQAVPDEHGSIKAVDRVRELSRDRLNLLSRVAQGPPKVAPRPSNTEGPESKTIPTESPVGSGA